MATIIPRWEWRTFGPRSARPRSESPALTPTGVQESDELYLLPVRATTSRSAST